MTKGNIMKVRGIIVAIIICCAGLTVKAQTGGDSVKIVKAMISLDTIGGSVSSHLLINFFIGNVADIEKVYVKVGSSANTADLVQEELVVKNHEGRFYYYTNSRNDIIRNWAGHTMLSYDVTEPDKAKAKWVTIYARKNNGNQSTPVNYQVH